MLVLAGVELIYFSVAGMYGAVLWVRAGTELTAQGCLVTAAQSLPGAEALSAPLTAPPARGWGAPGAGRGHGRDS